MGHTCKCHCHYSTADRNKATVKVRIGLIEKDERVLPDMGARVSFLRKVEETENQVKKEGVMVPLNAVGEMDGASYVLIVSKGKVKLNEVEVDVNEAFINRVVAGQPAVANLNAYPKWDIPANVIAIIPTADRNKATVKVRIGLIEKDERVLPDMGARVSFLRKVEETENQVKKEGVMVPLNAVGEMDGASYVLIVSKGKVKLNEVEVDVNEAFINRVVAGQPAVANLNAYPKWDIPANVIAIIQQRTEIKQQ
jgi:uncharacterized protein YciU (UPF0263 family)